MSDELTELRDLVHTLADRVSALEGTADKHPRAAAPDGLWALSELQERRPLDESTADGIVMMAGSLTLPTGTPVAWQYGAGTAELLETEWSERASTLAALGHPVRLELLRHILAGVHATADLAAVESLGTTGQLHHHLRQLVAAGWVRQGGRGNYEVPASRVVPLMICLVGAER